MAKNRMLNTKFWSDNYISDLDPSEKLLFLYFITNPYTNICGIYEITLKQIALDTGFDKEMVLKILNRFKEDNKIYYINGWICVKNFTKHQKASGNVKLGVEKGLIDVPEQVMAKIRQLLDTGGTQGVHSPKPEPESELESELKLELESKKNTQQQKTENFITEVKIVIGDQEVNQNEVMKFCSYWTEPNKSKTKLRWELQPTFDIARRLGTWLRNDSGFNNKKIINIPE